MKKKLAIMLASALAAATLAGCTDGTNHDQENTDPVISGVEDTATTVAGEEFDALAGVTATDREDGDLTDRISVRSIPEMTFTDGVATPSAPGSYELIYSVTDSGNATGNAYCTLTVTQAASEPEEVYTFSFEDVTPTEADARGWTASIDEAAEGTATLKEGSYVFDIAHLNGVGDGSVTLNKTLTGLTNGDYQFVVWARSSVDTYVHLLAEDAANEEWSTVGPGAWNVRVGTKVVPISTTFAIGDDTTKDIDLRIHMGKITPNPENPEDATPDTFSLAIEKVALYCTSGTETRVDLYEEDFAESAATVTTQAGDGAAASVAASDGAAEVAIDSYHDDGVGGVWSLKVDVALGDAAIESGVKYGYSVDVTAENAQAGELLVENQDASLRANFASFSLAAGETKTLTGTFTSEATIASGAVLRFQIGNPSEGVTSNTLTIDNVTFYRLDGDLRTDRVLLDRFLLFGAGSSNELNTEKPYEVFNGSDDRLSQLGIGTMYTEDGKLVYRIEEAGEADWHNKIAIGYRDNPLVLPGGAYFTFRIKIKASEELSFNYYVHDLNAVDWDSGLIIRENAVTIGPEETTLEFTTTTALIGESDFEMLFQFGSAALAELGEVVIEISEITVLQSVLI